jgi:hypothetical protein
MGIEPHTPQPPPSRFARWLVRNKEAISGLQSLAGILGWGVGGLWVLYLLDPISARRPELALTQQVSSVRVAPDIIMLKADVTMTEITKASARLGCATVEVMSFLPIPDKYVAELRTTLADPDKDPALTLPVLKSGHQREFPIVVPAGSSKVFTHITFIPDHVPAAEVGASGAPIKSLIVKTRFFERADCNGKDGEWPVTTVYEVPPQGADLMAPRDPRKP